MSKEKEDCPVSDALCVARMETLRAEIEGIKATIKMSAALITIVLAGIAILLKVI
jgi:hypothetical protein